MKHRIHNHEFRVPTIQRVKKVVDQTVKLTLRMLSLLHAHIDNSVSISQEKGETGEFFDSLALLWSGLLCRRRVHEILR
jgi:hypothetical protein